MNEKVGVIKEIDNLGRIVIPKEIRERLLLDKKVECKKSCVSSYTYKGG